MKRPVFNPKFLLLCVMLSMLAIIAIGALFGARGGAVPPWIVGILGGGDPPAAQMELIDWNTVTSLARISETPLAHHSADLQISEVTIADLPPGPAQIPSVVYVSPLKTYVALFALMLFAGFNFRKRFFRTAN